jgi:LemA protein
MIGWVILAILIVLVLWVILVYNRLVSLRNEVQSAWKQIDVQLRRRHDLIPNLVSAVKGTMEFEQDTLEKVISARAKAASAVSVGDKALAEGALGAALGRLFALMENYPHLKSNENVMQLQEELVSTENRISFARQNYNDLIANYRIKQEVFPNNMVASVLGNFGHEEYFQADEADRVPPKAEVYTRSK